MAVSDRDKPSSSETPSSQAICTFLNQFEKDLEGDECLADMEELIAREMDTSQSGERHDQHKPISEWRG
jgi:hypothetical protein